MRNTSAITSRPVARRKRFQNLRLPISPYIVLHVGHMKETRGIQVMKSIQALPGVQALLVTSTSTSAESDAGMRRELQEAGVRVIDTHLPNIEAYYRASDCYLFPVTSSQDAIELPLSILEAMASNLPIVTTRFGGVPGLMEGAGPGVAFAREAGDFPRLISEFRQAGPRPRLRERVGTLTWEAMAEKVSAALEQIPARPVPRIAEARG